MTGALLLLMTLASTGHDWPQLLGPERSGVYSGDDLAESWPKGGPPLVWKRDVGQGFSAPVVAEGRLVLFHRLGERETVEALDTRTGRPVWKFDYPTAYRDDFGFDEGPRATPTIAGGKVYTFGAEGQLHCLDFKTGQKLWSVDTRSAFGVPEGVLRRRQLSGRRGEAGAFERRGNRRRDCCVRRSHGKDGLDRDHR